MTEIEGEPELAKAIFKVWWIAPLAPRPLRPEGRPSQSGLPQKGAEDVCRPRRHRSPHGVRGHVPLHGQTGEGGRGQPLLCRRSQGTSRGVPGSRIDRDSPRTDFW